MDSAYTEMGTYKQGVPRKIIAVDAAGGRELVHHLLPPIMGVESSAAMRIAL